MSATWKTDGNLRIKLCCGTCANYHGQRGIFANPYCGDKHNESDPAPENPDSEVCEWWKPSRRAVKEALTQKLTMKHNA